MNAPAQPPLLTVALALYNEKESLRAAVADILTAPLPAGWRLELLIIDDGSTDGSAAIADELAVGDPRVRIVRHAPNQGLGQVYRTGFDAARGDWLTFLPADGQYRMSEVVRLIQAQREENLDLVLGLIPAKRHDSKIGRALSIFERLYIQLLFGRTPPFQGPFLIKTGLLHQMPLFSQGRGWAIVMEMIIRADRAGCRWSNAPTRLSPRQSGKSKVNNLRVAATLFFQLLQLRWILWVHPTGCIQMDE